MPFELQFDNLPAGRSIQFARPGEMMPIETSGFLTTDDGAEFAKFAEGLSADLARSTSQCKRVPESQIDHLLMIVRPDKTATVYCNELQTIVEVRVKRNVIAGEAVYKNDISDINRLQLRTNGGDAIVVPPNCGVEYLFSNGWRKGLFFDFAPLMKDAAPRSEDLEVTFGYLYARLNFHEFYTVSEQAWDQLFEWGLFPFALINLQDRTTLLEHAKYAYLSDELLESICKCVRMGIDGRIQSWSSRSLFESHIDFLRKAAERFIAQDYVSAIQILYPRIEGVLRNCLSTVANGVHASQSTMAKHAGMRTPEHSILLPRRFERYLLRFFFRNFDVNSALTPLSRHTIAHGVSTIADYSELRAAIGFLILDQIFYYSFDASTQPMNSLIPAATS